MRREFACVYVCVNVQCLQVKKKRKKTRERKNVIYVRQRVSLILPETACPLEPRQWKLMSGSAYIRVTRSIAAAEKVDGRLPAEKLTERLSGCAMKSCGVAEAELQRACLCAVVLFVFFKDNTSRKKIGTTDRACPLTKP